VVSTQLKNMLVKLDSISPGRDENQKMFELPPSSFSPVPFSERINPLIKKNPTRFKTNHPLHDPVANLCDLRLEKPFCGNKKTVTFHEILGFVKTLSLKLTG